MVDEFEGLGKEAREFLREQCNSFYNPECPSCKHKLTEHKSSGDSDTCFVWIDMPPSFYSGFWKQKTKLCPCTLNRGDIEFNLIKKAQENIQHEERARELAAQGREAPKPPVNFSIKPDGHAVQYNCCEYHNNAFNGPDRYEGGDNGYR